VVNTALTGAGPAVGGYVGKPGDNHADFLFRQMTVEVKEIIPGPSLFVTHEFTGGGADKGVTALKSPESDR
jgi:hypothetical protein